MADATKIFGGPAKKIEMDDNSGFSSATDLGYEAGEAQVVWEPNPRKTLNAQNFQLNGIGKITLKLQQTDTATLTALKAGRTTAQYFRITDYKDVTWVTSIPCLIQYAPDQKFNESDEHVFVVTGQVAAEEPDDWMEFQT